MARRSRKFNITGCQVTTAGVTSDGRYSLAINEVNGVPCLCVHKCTLKGGLHMSAMDDKSLVTCMDRRTVAAALELLDGPLWACQGGGPHETEAVQA